MSPRKPKAKKGPDEKSWARKAVEGMLDSDVRHWCARLGIKTSPPRDTRSPIERMVDEACGVGATPKRGSR